MNQGKSILYIACTLDGFIAGENNDLSFLSVVEKDGEDYYGFGDFIKTIDTIIMGRTTYDWINQHAPEFIHSNKETYIITHAQNLSGSYNSQDVKVYSGDLKHLVTSLLSQGKRIFIEGGSEIIQQLLSNQLIDEFYIAIVPILIGKGTRLFGNGDYPEQKLKLQETTKYDTGLVHLHYVK